MEDAKRLPSGRDFKPKERIDLKLMRFEWLEDKRGRDARAWFAARFRHGWKVVAIVGTMTFGLVEYADKIHELIAAFTR